MARTHALAANGPHAGAGRAAARLQARRRLDVRHRPVVDRLACTSVSGSKGYTLVGERVEIHIEELIWEDDVVAKVTEKHGLEPQEAESILENQPMFFKNLPGFDRLATHIVIGRSHD